MVIELKHIEKYYPVPTGQFHALKDIHLNIKKGEIFGIIGRSGAGKSTLIRLLNLLERPSSGQVLLEGQDITQLDVHALNQVRQRVGMVFQHFNLLNSKTVLDNVILPMKIAGVSKTEREKRAIELLQLVGLETHMTKYPSQLSGGQKQRVGIARSLANNPTVLLCDEATSALDPETTQSILALLRDIAEKMNLTIVLITHSMEVIRTICDRVVVMERGEIIEEGEVLDVFLHPQHDTTCSLLSESGVDARSWKHLANNVTGRIIRLTYKGEDAERPILSELSREHGVNLNILQGIVGQIKDVRYGQMVIALECDPVKYPFVEAFFAAQDVVYEVLKK